METNQSNGFEIIPKTGVGNVRLGWTVEQVKEQFGVPNDEYEESYSDGKVAKILEYTALGMELSFDEEDNFRLTCITVYNETSTLFGIPIIGLSETAFLERISELTGSKPTIEDDADSFGKEYYVGSLEMLFWIHDNKLINICILPKFDAEGNNPIWPEAAQND